MDTTTILLGGLSALSSVVIYLFARQVRAEESNRVKLERCEESHASTAVKLAYLEGNQKGVTDLARQVLEVVGARK